MRFRRFCLRKQRDQDLAAGLRIALHAGHWDPYSVTGSFSPASIRGFGPLAIAGQGSAIHLDVPSRTFDGCLVQNRGAWHIDPPLSPCS
jgi:hypothetical protein